jgi:hypothetical protein
MEHAPALAGLCAFGIARSIRNAPRHQAIEANFYRSMRPDYKRDRSLVACNLSERHAGMKLKEVEPSSRYVNIDFDDVSARPFEQAGVSAQRFCVHD